MSDDVLDRLKRTERFGHPCNPEYRAQRMSKLSDKNVDISNLPSVQDVYEKYYEDMIKVKEEDPLLYYITEICDSFAELSCGRILAASLDDGFMGPVEDYHNVVKSSKLDSYVIDILTSEYNLERLAVIKDCLELEMSKENLCVEINTSLIYNMTLFMEHIEEAITKFEDDDLFIDSELKDDPIFNYIIELLDTVSDAPSCFLELIAKYHKIVGLTDIKSILIKECELYELTILYDAIKFCSSFENLSNDVTNGIESFSKEVEMIIMDMSDK